MPGGLRRRGTGRSGRFRRPRRLCRPPGLRPARGIGERLPLRGRLPGGGQPGGLVLAQDMRKAHLRSMRPHRVRRHQGELLGVEAGRFVKGALALQRSTYADVVFVFDLLDVFLKDRLLHPQPLPQDSLHRPLGFGGLPAGLFPRFGGGRLFLLLGRQRQLQLDQVFRRRQRLLLRLLAMDQRERTVVPQLALGPGKNPLGKRQKGKRFRGKRPPLGQNRHIPFANRHSLHRPISFSVRYIRCAAARSG